jgi:hypothetical protein
MKIVKIFFISLLLLELLNAMTTKVEENHLKKVYKVLKSEKAEHCMKPGLAVDWNYTSEHVDAGVISNVHIDIFTPLIEGVLKVNIKSVGVDRLDFEEQHMTFELSSDQKNQFPIDLEVLASVDGEYFLTFELSVEGKGGRIFEVPVHFGTPLQKQSAKNIELTQDGMAISIAKAVEEIE